MNIIDANIGSAKDNASSPIHNWYKFSAGFSYRFVDLILEDYLGQNLVVYEPFSGCGTTLVECQKRGVRAIGNEGQELMCNIINAKLNWDIPRRLYDECIASVRERLNGCKNTREIEAEYHPLLVSLYDADSLRDLYCIRDSIRNFEREDLRDFFNLALSQTLHKAAIHPIAVPYISRSKTLLDSGAAREKFERIADQMMRDIEQMPHRERLARVYCFDSRKRNPFIQDASCGLCITSPPYLNNLDYGEVSKVHSHFFEMTRDWNDITNIVRKNLVTGATTHYRDSDFCINQFVKGDFAQCVPEVIKQLVPLYLKIEENSKPRGGRKSFHILMMLYFEDMFAALKEMRRVLSDNAFAYLILGDSAPYGVYVPTTQFLGEIALAAGFKRYSIHKIRSRGTKWKGLSNRHSIALSENILVLGT